MEKVRQLVEVLLMKCIGMTKTRHTTDRNNIGNREKGNTMCRFWWNETNLCRNPDDVEGREWVVLGGWSEEWEEEMWLLGVRGSGKN